MLVFWQVGKSSKQPSQILINFPFWTCFCQIRIISHCASSYYHLILFCTLVFLKLDFSQCVKIAEEVKSGMFLFFRKALLWLAVCKKVALSGNAEVRQIGMPHNCQGIWSKYSVCFFIAGKVWKVFNQIGTAYSSIKRRWSFKEQHAQCLKIILKLLVFF